MSRRASEAAGLLWLGRLSRITTSPSRTSPAQERVNWVMDEVMSGRMSQADGMVEMARAHEMMREEACARTTHPEHRWEE